MYVAQMPWGAIVLSSFIVDNLGEELGRIVEFRAPCIRVRMRYGD